MEDNVAVTSGSAVDVGCGEDKAAVAEGAAEDADMTAEVVAGAVISAGVVGDCWSSVGLAVSDIIVLWEVCASLAEVSIGGKLLAVAAAVFMTTKTVALTFELSLWPLTVASWVFIVGDTVVSVETALMSTGL